MSCSRHAEEKRATSSKTGFVQKPRLRATRVVLRPPSSAGSANCEFARSRYGPVDGANQLPTASTAALPPASSKQPGPATRRFSHCGVPVWAMYHNNDPMREVEMTTLGFQSPVQNWKVLYRAAVFERDKKALRTRLSDAEGAIIDRARELLHANGDYIEERDALEDALYTLRAFRNASQQHVA
jgi:hypothetical protein